MAIDVNLFLEDFLSGDNDKKKEEEKKKKEEQAKKKDSAMRGVVVESTAPAAPYGFTFGRWFIGLTIG
jgi:hypothetical protein